MYPERIQSLINQGDTALQSGRFQDAYTAYSNAQNEAELLYGHLQPELYPILEKFVRATLRANNQEWYLKSVVKALRAMLYIAERKYGLNAPELIPVLTELVQFYDYDGAHMLAIEVKQRIDDIVERQSGPTPIGKVQTSNP